MIRFVGLSLLLVVALAGCGVRGAGTHPDDAAAQDPNSGTPIDPPKDLADFTLTSQTGKPVRLSDLKGRVVLLFFGYTNCPDACPTTLAEWKRVKAVLGPAAQHVAFVFISVDGARDTPAVLAKFLGRFDPTFIGLTGSSAAVTEVGKDYGLFFKSQAQAGGAAYQVDHSPPSYLIDKNGRLRMIYSYGIPENVISADLKKLAGRS